MLKQKVINFTDWEKASGGRSHIGGGEWSHRRVKIRRKIANHSGGGRNTARNEGSAGLQHISDTLVNILAHGYLFSSVLDREIDRYSLING